MSMSKSSKLNVVINLFFSFLKIGFFTFGGGWSIVAQLFKTYVDEKKVITNEQFTDIISVGRSLPGIMLLNVSLLFGYHMAGVFGGLACMLGVAIPPFFVLYIIANIYDFINSSVLLSSAMIGVRASVVPIILFAITSMVKSSLRNWICIVIMLAVFFANYFLGASSIIVILFGALAGLFILGRIDSNSINFK